MSPVDPAIVVLQRGVPLVPRPFRAAASSCGLSEAELLERARQALASGLARRFGAVFDASGLGYRSVLCAADVPAGMADSALRFLVEDPGVTHLYLRGWAPELPPEHPARLATPVPAAWFTFSEHADRFEARLEEIRRRLAPAELFVLPALQKFKVQVVFGEHAGSAGHPRSPASPALAGEGFRVSDLDRRLVRLLQGHLEPVADLWADVAGQAGLSETELLDRLQLMKKAGALRRLALILRHREAGFVANAMCVWAADPALAAVAGPRLAAHGEVTHCYRRTAFPGFPYTLYAMVHARSWNALPEIFARLASAAGLQDGRMLCSLKELKKASMTFFPE